MVRGSAEAGTSYTVRPLQGSAQTTELSSTGDSSRPTLGISFIGTGTACQTVTLSNWGPRPTRLSLLQGWGDRHLYAAISGFAIR